MENLIEVILLGIVEGITEFLPISSTGHLLIAEHWLGRRSDLFNIAIQAGAILAVVLIYRRRLLELSLEFFQPANRDYALKLGAAFALTCAGGLVANLWALSGMRHVGAAMTAGRMHALSLYWAFVDLVWIVIFGLLYLT